MADMENEFLDDNEIITLEDINGNNVDFYHIATFDYKEKWYIILQPVEPMEGVAEDEVIIYELGVDEDGNDKFVPIEDETLLNEVFEEFLRLDEECCGCGEDCDCEGDCDCNDEDCDCGCNGCKLGECD